MNFVQKLKEFQRVCAYIAEADTNNLDDVRNLSLYINVAEEHINEIKQIVDGSK